VTGPGWLTAGFAVLMLVIAGSCAVRLVSSWRRLGWSAKPEGNVLHVLMGIAMAGMLEPRLSPVPDAVWLAVFALAAVWFGWRAVSGRTRPQAAGRDSRSAAHHAVPHAVQCAAMLYMLMPGRSAAGRLTMAMAGMSGSGLVANPAVALLLVVFMIGYIFWTADQLASRARARTTPVPAGPHAPGAAAERVMPLRFEAGSAIVMSIAMGYMLLPML
jgi:Domain of unknown function (DUF5134)